MKTLLFAALPMTFVVGVAAAQAQDAAFAATTLNLTAVGDVKAVPDRANVNLGVTSEAPTAAEALGDDSSRMTAVIAALKKLGVADRRIRTQGLNVQAQYVFTPNQPQRLTGYRASNQVTVTVDDIDKLGALLDAAVAAGANQVNGVTFSLKSSAAAEDQARTEAVKALKAKAEIYAAATGLKIWRLVRLTEGVQNAAPLSLGLAEVVVTGARASPAPPVSAGQLDVRVQVTAIYELTR